MSYTHENKNRYRVEEEQQFPKQALERTFRNSTVYTGETHRQCHMLMYV